VKYVVYVGGILLLTLGIALTIQSNLGASPFDALLVGLSLNVGLSVGSWEIILACVLICGNALLSKQKPEVLGLLTAFITGLGIDLWLFLLQNWAPFEMWYSKLCCFGIGLIIIGVGTSAYLHTNFAPIPIDRLTLIIQKLAKTNLLLSRTLIYLTFLLAAMLLNGPIGVGTLLTVFLGGVLLNFFMPLTKRALDCILTNSRISQNHTKDHKRSIT
jgi:uncharacterized membrane protein YczE